MNTHTQTRIASNDMEAAKRDNDEVDWFAAAMKEKLAKARAKGRGGWQTCPPEELSRMLREHVEKGDPVDVANFCMFLWSLEHGIAAAPGFVCAPNGEEPASFVDVHSAAGEARARVANSKGKAVSDKNHALEQTFHMLRKYRSLCVEVGRGDSYWLQEILDTEAALRDGQADNTALLNALKKADADFEREGFGEAGPYRAHIRAAIDAAIRATRGGKL